MAPETPRRRRNGCRSKFTSVGDHEKFLARIKRSLYYGRLPSTQRLSLPVTELATELFSAAQRNHSLKRLELEEASTVSRSACVSPCSLVLALLYIERLQSCQPSFLQDTTPSELYLVSVMVATKFLQDDGEDDGVVNEEWATSAGISTSHINQLERNFLNAIEWEVFVNEEAFWTRLRGLERDVALNEGVRRGWFSYTDLDVLLEKFDYASVAHTVLSVSAVCLTSYTASVLTLIASTLFVSQLQLLVSSFSGVGHTSPRILTAPSVDASFNSPDQPATINITDKPSQTYQPAVDVLASFILASISSCSKAHGNDSRQKCLEPNGQDESFMENPFNARSNLFNGQGNSEQFSDLNGDAWNNSGSQTWLSWIENLGTWFRRPILGQWVSPPDWTLSISQYIEKSPSMNPAQLIPIQVY